MHKVMPLDRAMHTQDGASVAALNFDGPEGQKNRGRLKIRREAFLDQHSAAEDWCNRHFSAATLSLWQVAAPLTRRYARGMVLDAGSGRGAWRNVIASSAREYHSIDIGPRGDHEPTWIGTSATWDKSLMAPMTRSSVTRCWSMSASRTGRWPRWQGS
jgi:hypothetical protein